MRALLAMVPVTLFALANCGTTGGGASAPGDPANTTDGNARVASCRPTCSSPSDCGTPGDALYDSSHFACNAGRCEWQGCRSAAECNASAHGGKFLCQAAPDGPPSCVPACQRATDCVPPGAAGVGLDDASHFSCQAGACVWQGCRSTAECASATHVSKVSCERPPGATAATCVPTCTAATDCVIPGSGALGDAHHYACKAGRCEWLGCHSTAECTTALASSRYVCE